MTAFGFQIPSTMSRDALEAEVMRLRSRLSDSGRGSIAGTQASVDFAVGEGDDTRAGADGSARAADSDLQSALAASQEALRVSEERLAFAFEASRLLGWWDWDVVNDRLYAGSHFALMFGVEPERAAKGAPIAEFLAGIHPDDRDRIREAFGAVLRDGGEFSAEYRLQRDDGPVTWVYSLGRCFLSDEGQCSRFPGVVMDITARKASELRQAALLDLGERLRETSDVGAIAFTAAEVMAETLGATRAGFGIVDDVAETVEMQPDWRRPGTATLEGLHRFRDYGSFIDDLKRGEIVIIEDVTSDPRTAESAEALLSIGIRVLVNVPIFEQGRFVSVVFIHYDGPHAFSSAELDFVRTVADRAQVAFGRARAEERQSLLMRELSHRLKNNLTMVQAVVHQSLRNAPDLDAARHTVNARLLALAKAHDVVIKGGSGCGSVFEIVSETLQAHDDGAGRITVSGPPVAIGSATSLSLALMIHELATNAVKYGALSVPEGRVEVRWRKDGGPDGQHFELIWEESGGPRVHEPEESGFGTRLIRGGLSGVAGDQVALDFAPDGIVCRYQVPFSGLAETGV
ncbi:sensor histidine kinase [Fulvimarina manganoxydans]|nr:HWE histidine kinase domain-containing protein [Fulvimarina manganoxydans]